MRDPSLISAISSAAEAVVVAYRKGRKTLLAGNGGSAADAQHIAAEFLGRFCFDRPGIPSVALTTNTSALTAIGNDYGFDVVFARQLQSMGDKGDVFICMSTSGNSTNILKALEVCREKGIFSIGLAGGDGGAMKGMCDICICVPSDATPRIQESHILIGHAICAIVEEGLFGHLKP